MAIDVARLVRQLPSQYPFVLVDRVLEHDARGRLLARRAAPGGAFFPSPQRRLRYLTSISVNPSASLRSSQTSLRDQRRPSRSRAAGIGRWLDICFDFRTYLHKMQGV